MRRIHSALATVLATALLSLLAACSPYSYSKEIGTMSDSVNKLSAAYNASFDSIAADRAAELQAKAVSARARGQRPHILQTATCDTNSVPKDGDPEPCALYLQDPKDPKNTPEPKWTEAEEKRKPALDALKALKGYAGALAAVTNAADRTAYDAAVGQLAGAVSTVTSTANGVAPGASAAVSAGINIFGWLVGTALDEQRYDSLRKAVALVGKPLPPEEKPDTPQPKSTSVCYDPDPKDKKPPARSDIRIVTDALCWGLQSLGARQRELLKGQIAAMIKGLNYGNWTGDAYAKALGDTQTALNALDALRKANPGSAANDLADAHDKLVKAIEDPKNGYTAFLKAVGDFADKVAAVEAAIKAMTPTKKGK